MRLAAHDVAGLSRAIAAGSGAAITVFGALGLLAVRQAVPMPALTIAGTAPAPIAVAALCAAGSALLFLAAPTAAAVRRRTGYALAGLAATLGGLGLLDTLSGLPITVSITRFLAGTGTVAGPSALPPAAALALLLIGTALAVIDVGWIRVPGGGRIRVRPANPLLAGGAAIALVALVPALFALAFPSGQSPGLMSPLLAGALVGLAAGTVLARPEQGLLASAAGPGRGAAVGRRLGGALVAFPFVAAGFSAVAAHTGVSRPAAAISTGVVLAELALLGTIAHLLRSLERSDRQQRSLVAALREKREFADTLLQSMNEAVMVLDPELRVVEVNRRWRELTGRPAAEAVGRRPPFPWEPPPTDDDVLLLRADGTAVAVLTTMATVPGADGQARGHVATYVDITDRKRAEQALATHTEEVERRNAELRESNQRLEAALAFKQDLVAMLSHDVAQPVSSIASLAELLTEDWAGLPDETRFELATKIDKNTRRLINLMNDLTLLFRLDAGSVTARRTPVPVREVVEMVIQNTSPNRPDVAVAIDASVFALADRGHLWHVVQNLLSNALKYGEAPVEIRGWQDADRVILAVQDHGKGIAEDVVPGLFDRFMRGAGMGLFIVRHLVEANGGSVHYEPVLPHGARLVVTLEPANTTVPAVTSDAGDRS